MLTLYSVYRASSSIVARCFKRIRAETSSLHVRWFVGRCPRVVTFRLNELDKNATPLTSLAGGGGGGGGGATATTSSSLLSTHFHPFHSLLKHFLLFSFFLGGFLVNELLFSFCFLFQDFLAEPEKVGPTPYRSRTRKFFCAVIRGPVDDEEDAGRRRRRSGARWCTADNKTPLPHHVARTESVGRSSGGHVFPPSTLCCSTSNALIRPKRADGPRLTTSNEPRPFHSQSSGRAGPSSSSPFLSRLEYIREYIMLL